MVRNCYTMIITKKVEIVYTQTLGTNVASLLWLHWSTFFNLMKLQCKQTVVTVWFLHRLCQQNPRHWYDKRNMDCKNQRNRMLDRRTDHILSFFACFSVIQKASKFCGQACRLELRLLAWRAMHGSTHRRKQWGRPWHKTIFLILANWTWGVPRVGIVKLFLMTTFSARKGNPTHYTLYWCTHCMHLYCI